MAALGHSARYSDLTNTGGGSTFGSSGSGSTFGTNTNTNSGGGLTGPTDGSGNTNGTGNTASGGTTGSGGATTGTGTSSPLGLQAGRLSAGALSAFRPLAQSSRSCSIRRRIITTSGSLPTARSLSRSRSWEAQELPACRDRMAPTDLAERPGRDLAAQAQAWAGQLQVDLAGRLLAGRAMDPVRTKRLHRSRINNSRARFKNGLAHWNRVPQGLKPHFLQLLSARLKPCPCYKTDS